jgi:acetyl esterase/lipase
MDADHDIWKRIRELGTVLAPTTFAATAEILAPAALRPDGLTVERDLAYGPHERHRLDLFYAPDGIDDKPVLVYVHGGGFVQGDKRSPGLPFYDNFGAWAAQTGAIGVTITYRLAPQHPWPAGAEDLAAALDLLQAEVATRGGDPKSIFLIGQSAGAAHVASFLATSALHRGPAVAGAVLLSGLYDVASFEHGPLEAAYYGADPADFGAKSSLSGLLETPVPCLFSIAEYDPPKFQQQALLLVERWFTKRRAWPHLLYLPNHNHMSPALAIGSTNDVLSREIGAFVIKHRAMRGK